MIAIDTNVLLRYLLQDDTSQTSRATALILGQQPVLITDVVLAETIWVLTGKKYQASKQQIIDTLHALFAEPNICFEEPAVVWCSLKDYEKSTAVRVNGKNKDIDFQDALIVNKSKQHTEKTQEQFHGIYTFDKAAQSLPGVMNP